MDYKTAIYHIINSLEGGSVSRQFLDVMAGESIADQNENAIRDIRKLLAEIGTSSNDLGREANNMLEYTFPKATS